MPQHRQTYVLILAFQSLFNLRFKTQIKMVCYIFRVTSTEITEKM